MTNAITGHNGQKLAKSGQRRARVFAEHGLTGFDDPGRRGRPRGVASLMAQKTGKSARTIRRRMELARDLLDAIDLHPNELAGTSLHKMTEIEALCRLPKREALVLLKAAQRGRAVSAAKRFKAMQPADQRVQEEVNALIRHYNRISPKARAIFTDRLLAKVREGPQS
jgi:hypothetical protein